MKKLFKPGYKNETRENFIEVASQASFNSLLLPGLNPSICASQPELGIQSGDGQAGSWAAKLGQGWLVMPQIVESGRGEPMRKDLSETAGKMSGRGKKRKLLDTDSEGALHD